MPMKEVIVDHDRNCSRCKQIIKSGEKALWIFNEEMLFPITIHITCPKGISTPFTKWKRKNPIPQEPKIDIRCTNCKKMFDSPKKRGVPLICPFCSVVGMCELVESNWRGSNHDNQKA